MIIYLDCNALRRMARKALREGTLPPECDYVEESDLLDIWCYKGDPRIYCSFAGLSETECTPKGGSVDDYMVHIGSRMAVGILDLGSAEITWVS